MKNILIIGASGFLGSHLYNFLKLELNSYFVQGTYFKNKTNPELYFLDLTNKRELEYYILEIKPDILIWLSGWKPKECEENYSQAIRLHIDPLINIIEILNREKINSKIIYLSSDYVFDGIKGNYTEEDKTNPRTNYGKLKGASEQILLNLHSNSKIIRTSAVMGQRGIFFDWMFNTLQNEDKISCFEDLFFSPTPIQFLNEMIKEIVLNYDSIEERIIHISGGKSMSRFEFVKMVSKYMPNHKIQIFPERSIKIQDKNSKEALFGKNLSLIPSKFVKDKMKISFEEYIQQDIQKALS